MHATSWSQKRDQNMSQFIIFLFEILLLCEGKKIAKTNK